MSYILLYKYNIFRFVHSKNVANGVEKIKYQKIEKKILTIDEDKALYHCAINHKYGLFILTLCYCRLRPEEIIPIKLTDVDLENKLLYINSAVSLVRNKPSIKDTKTKRIRKVIIPDFMVDLFKIEIQKQKDNNSNYLFGKETDKTSMLTKQALSAHLDSERENPKRDIDSYIDNKILKFDQNKRKEDILKDWLSYLQLNYHN